MPKKMLIDATHPEETRVVVVDGQKVEDFDFESASKRQLAGNIYLAKVTRVEPSLQAAFIDYGGNRHGFLAFAEIHPDYYQIPVADRQALIAEERAMAARSDEEEGEGDAPAEERGENGNGRRRDGRRTRVRSRGRGDRPERREGDAVATRDAQDPAGMETIDLGDEAEEGADEGLSPMATVADTPVETPAPEEAAEEESSEDGVEVVEKDDTIEVVAEEEDHLRHAARAQSPRARAATRYRR
jgi:ribonuclease E